MMQFVVIHCHLLLSDVCVCVVGCLVINASLLIYWCPLVQPRHLKACCQYLRQSSQTDRCGLCPPLRNKLNIKLGFVEDVWSVGMFTSFKCRWSYVSRSSSWFSSSSRTCRNQRCYTWKHWELLPHKVTVTHFPPQQWQPGTWPTSVWTGAKVSPATMNPDGVTSEHHGTTRAALLRIVSDISRLPAAPGHPEASQSESL